MEPVKRNKYRNTGSEFERLEDSLFFENEDDYWPSDPNGWYDDEEDEEEK